MPPLSLLTGGLDFSNKFVVLKAGADGAANFATPALAAADKAVTWNYGNFITLVINFIIVAFCIFLVVRAMNKMKRPAPDAPAVTKDCPACTMTIPIKATRCPHCTTELAARLGDAARFPSTAQHALRRAEPDAALGVVGPTDATRPWRKGGQDPAASPVG